MWPRENSNQVKVKSISGSVDTGNSMLQLYYVEQGNPGHLANEHLAIICSGGGGDF